MINILRWVVALPLAALAAFAVHMAFGFTFGIAHGFDEVELFWQSRYMAGMPISGTYIMLVTRVATACTLVSVAAWVVPRFKFQACVVLAIAITISSIALLIYLLYQSTQVGLTLGLGGWYRSLLELFSIIIGSAFGIGVAASLHVDKLRKLR